MERAVKDLDELEKEAAHFVHVFTPQKDEATLVTLSGELGAGKTAFVKAVAKSLGVGEVVNSPTFVLEKIYALPVSGVNPCFKRLIHIDAYRLESGKELAPLAFSEFMRDTENLILLEWPEKVMDALPKAAASIQIKPNPDNSRIFTYA